MHLFTSYQNEFESLIPDCHVRFTSEFDFKYIDETHKKIIDDIYGNKIWTSEQIKEKIINFQENNTEKSEMIVAPEKFFTNIRPRFYFDGIKLTSKLEKLSQSGNYGKGIMAYHEGNCHVFGTPRSQQEQRRYISPDSYNGIRALTPMFCFNDSDHDMTHQFYADALMMDDISHTKAYCKLDSSCT